ncbi:MAG: sugar ABC transporter ATP-binding protein, partial [Oscillospiraceae bacterium]|nr:sugar ABC transporter ATP-binding protein [Oscillospiraceae bacterium]
AGVYTRDGGTVEFDGKPLEHTTVQSSENAGIAFVHQELNLFNDLKVYENIFLRKEITNKFGILNKKVMAQKAGEMFNSLGVEIDPNAMVSELDTSKKQFLEISKALFANAELLILDEPTTALNNEEIEHLFGIVRRLRDAGKSFIFISHKMIEIFNLADRYTILRNGKFIKTGYIRETTPQEVTRLMVGSHYSDRSVYEQRDLGEPILELKNLSGCGFEDINLSVKRGEVVGFTGLKGAGITEMMQTIFGVLPITNGELRVEGRDVSHNSIHRAMTHKIAMIAANRKENSVIPDLSLIENNYIAEHALTVRRQYIHSGAEKKKYFALRDSLNIKSSSPDELITSLSGGNQQKVIVARWLNTGADIFLMDNPTQGIDVGAKAEIYRLIQELAKNGKTILVNTLEIPEIQKVADRCIVFYHGHIQAELKREEITEEQVMLCATNAIHAAEVLENNG